MFFFILGVLSASLVYLFLRRLRRHQVKAKWWGWLLFSLWLLYTLIVIATAYTLFTESAGRAALVSLVVFGVGAAIAVRATVGRGDAERFPLQVDCLLFPEFFYWKRPVVPQDTV